MKQAKEFRLLIFLECQRANVSWPSGLLAFWPSGLLAFWPSGLLAFWPSGPLAFWPCASAVAGSVSHCVRDGTWTDLRFPAFSRGEHKASRLLAPLVLGWRLEDD